MKVIKRDGRVQEYDRTKIALTLAHISDKLEQPMTRGDIDYVLEEVGVRLAGRESVSYSELRALVTESLSSCGFNAIARAYMVP